MTQLVNSIENFNLLIFCRIKLLHKVTAIEQNLGNAPAPAVEQAQPSTALQPHLQMTLEQCLSFITDDELVEFTPKNIRLRKMILNEGERKRQKKS